MILCLTFSDALLIAATAGVVLLEGIDGKIHRTQTSPYVSGAKAALKKKTRRAVVWRKSSEGIPLVKDTTTNNMKDALILQSRGFRFSEDDECEHCRKGCGPFVGCVVDDPSSDITISNGKACANCLWAGHRNRCSLRKYQPAIALSGCSNSFQTQHINC